LWEDIEVTDRQTFFTNSSPIEKSKLPLTPLGRDENQEIQISEGYLVDPTSNPVRDKESPPCKVFLKNEALCQRRFPSGFGEEGNLSTRQ